MAKDSKFFIPGVAMERHAPLEFGHCLAVSQDSPSGHTEEETNMATKKAAGKLKKGKKIERKKSPKGFDLLTIKPW